jgi:abnormal spindle-like microcephaly-associated protein
VQAAAAFLKERLYGQGDTMRSLASKGFHLLHEQDPRREFEFGVANLAVDLRDGMRLCKLVEVLTGGDNHQPHPKSILTPL